MRRIILLTRTFHWLILSSTLHWVFQIESDMITVSQEFITIVHFICNEGKSIKHHWNGLKNLQPSSDDLTKPKNYTASFMAKVFPIIALVTTRTPTVCSSEP